eukprot:g4241.t1
MSLNNSYFLLPFILGCSLCFLPTLPKFLAQTYFTESVVHNSEISDLLLVADLDHGSKVSDEKWRSTIRRSQLIRNSSNGKFTLKFLNDYEVSTGISRNKRSMELSVLVSFANSLFSVCDYTGVVYKIIFSQESARAVPDRILISGPQSGDVQKKLKGMKAEWATVKDGTLFIGSVGKEWIDSKGNVLHNNSEWIKTLDSNGTLNDLNWKNIFNKMRVVTRTTFPNGYLWHEAIFWFAEEKKWVVLPRKASTSTPYSPKADETMGTNLLILASEDWSDIEVRRIGPLEPLYGFTALRKLPGTFDDEDGNPTHLFVALKVREQETEEEVITDTKLAVFDLQGRFYTDPPFLHVSKEKFEGLEFV